MLLNRPEPLLYRSDQQHIRPPTLSIPSIQDKFVNQFGSFVVIDHARHAGLLGYNPQRNLLFFIRKAWRGHVFMTSHQRGKIIYMTKYIQINSNKAVLKTITTHLLRSLYRQ